MDWVFYKKSMHNIPLEKAMLTWNPTYVEADTCSVGKPGDVKVVPHPEQPNNIGYDESFGACNAEYAQASEEKKMLLLYREAWQIVIRDKIDPQKMHDALLAIPEFRETLAEDVRGTE